MCPYWATGVSLLARKDAGAGNLQRGFFVIVALDFLERGRILERYSFLRTIILLSLLFAIITWPLHHVFQFY